MILPIIAALSRDLFLTVPDELQEGAAALGATRWEIIRGVVLPTTASGVAAATVLGLGRALGEAIAVLQIIGDGSGIPASWFEPGNSLASRIANDFQNPQSKYHATLAVLPGADPARVRAGHEPARPVDRRPLRCDQGDGPVTELAVTERHPRCPIRRRR